MATDPISTKNLALLKEAQQSSSLVFLSGFHALKHALRFGAEIFCIVTTDPEKLSTFIATLAPDLPELIHIKIESVERGQMKEIHPNRLHWTEVWAVAKRPVIDIQGLLKNKNRTAPLVVLEDPKNLGNLGASIRAAAALGASGLVVIGESDPWSPRAVQGASGLQFALPTGNIEQMTDFAGTLVVFDPEGKDITQVVISPDAIFLFGTEREGVADATKKHPGALKVRIPMRSGVSSLNLAASVSVALSSVSFAGSHIRS